MTDNNGDRQPTGLFSHPQHDADSKPAPRPTRDNNNADDAVDRDFARQLFSNRED